jgi:hypothetical protein
MTRQVQGVGFTRATPISQASELSRRGPLIEGPQIITLIAESRDVAGSLRTALLISTSKGHNGQGDRLTKGEMTMKRFAASIALAGGFSAALLGFAGAAHADLSDVIWNQQQQASVYVPHVDNSIRHSR